MIRTNKLKIISSFLCFTLLVTDFRNIYLVLHHLIFTIIYFLFLFFWYFFGYSYFENIMFNSCFTYIWENKNLFKIYLYLYDRLINSFTCYSSLWTWFCYCFPLLLFRFSLASSFCLVLVFYNRRDVKAFFWRMFLSTWFVEWMLEFWSFCSLQVMILMLLVILLVWDMILWFSVPNLLNFFNGYKSETKKRHQLSYVTEIT